MSPFLKTWRWPLAALAVSLAMLATAHAFERFAYLAPCQLCLRQREVYWAAVAMAATGLILWNIRNNRRFLVAFNVMLALVFMTGAVVAMFHTGVEWKWWPAPAGCTANAVDVMSLDLGGLDERTAILQRAFVDVVDLIMPPSPGPSPPPPAPSRAARPRR